MVLPLRDINPTKTIPLVTISLIIINVFIFLFELSLLSVGKLDSFIASYSLTPMEIISGTSTIKPLPYIYLSVLFSMFLHGGFVHIAGNMLYLWIFGNNVEDNLGHFRFLIFYLLCGIGGAVAHVLSNPSSQIPTLGASGAIAGVLGAYLILFPGARIITLIPLFFFIELVELPAFIVIGLWFVLQLANGLASIAPSTYQDLGGVAWFAHIGGFLTGIFLVLLLRKRKKKTSYNFLIDDF